MEPAFKIPLSVLVVIYTAQRNVLLLRRTERDVTAQAYWQSVTGSKDFADEAWRETAAREVWEETGIDCREGTSLAACLQDWNLENVYPIYAQWLHRYAPGVIMNTEHVFGLQVPEGTWVTLSPREHTDFQWLPCEDAADLCFSPSNAEAILQLDAFLERAPGSKKAMP
jgi:dATP pyrophosphohydrolase